jgi:hypothetical protein
VGEVVTIPKTGVSAAKILWGQIVIVMLIVLATTWTAT